MVAEHEVRARAGGDGVAEVAAEHGVRVLVRADGVDAAHRRVDGPHRRHRRDRAVGALPRASRAEEGVRAVGADVRHPAAVAEDDVASGAGRDVVPAEAAEDDQAEGGRTPVHGVVVGVRPVGRLELTSLEGLVVEAARRRDHGVARDHPGRAGDLDGELVAASGGEEQPDQVELDVHDIEAGVHDVAVALQHDRVGVDRAVAGPQVGVEVEHVLVRALRVEHEEAVRTRLQVDGDVVVAEAGVQPGDGAYARGAVGRLDEDRVGAEARPDADAVGEAACRRVRQVAGREAAHADALAGRALAGDRGRVGRRAVTAAAALVGDEQRVAARAGVDVELAVDVVQRAGQELGLADDADRSLVGDVDAVIAGAEVQVRRGHCAADVEHVVAGAREDVEGLEADVGDAVPAGLVCGLAAGADRDHADGRAGQLAAEGDEVERVGAVLELPDHDAVGAARTRCDVLARQAFTAGVAVGAVPVLVEVEEQVVEALADRLRVGSGREGDVAVARDDQGEARSSDQRLHGVEAVAAGATHHAETREAGLRQPADLGDGLGGVVDHGPVVAGSAVDGDLGDEVVDAAAGGAEVDRVVAASAADQGVAVDGAQRDVVVTAAGDDRRVALVRGLDGEVVGAVAEHDPDVLEVAVGDAPRQQAAGDHRVGRHAQALQPRRAQRADIRGRAVLVVHDQPVDLGALDGLGVGAGSRDRVARGLARQQDRQVAVEVDGVLVGVVAAVDEQRTLDAGRAPGDLRELLQLAAVGEAVVLGGDRHRLLDVPVARVEGQRGRVEQHLDVAGLAVVALVADDVAAGVGVHVVDDDGGLRQQPGEVDRDRLAGARCPGEADGDRVGVAALDEQRVSVGLGDDDALDVVVVDEHLLARDRDAGQLEHGHVEADDVAFPGVDGRDGRGGVAGDHVVLAGSGAAGDADERAGQAAADRRQRGAGESDLVADGVDRRDGAAQGDVADRVGVAGDDEGVADGDLAFPVLRRDQDAAVVRPDRADLACGGAGGHAHEVAGQVAGAEEAGGGELVRASSQRAHRALDGVGGRDAGRQVVVVRALDQGVVHGTDLDDLRQGATRGEGDAHAARPVGRAGELHLESGGRGHRHGGRHDRVAVQRHRVRGRRAAAAGRVAALSDREAAARLGDADAHQVIVDDERTLARGDELVVRADAARHRSPGVDGEADDTGEQRDRARALGAEVLQGPYEDGSGDAPVRVVEDEGGGRAPCEAAVAGDLDRAVAGVEGILHRGHHGDLDLGVRLLRQLQRVRRRVAGAEALGDRDAAGARRHDHAGRVVVDDLGGDVVDGHLVPVSGRAAHADADQPRVAEQVVRLRREGVAGDLDGVAAEPTEDVGLDGRVRRLDEDAVVALHRLDHQALDCDIGDVAAAAVHRVLGDHEDVADLGADHDDRVVAAAAVDVHRSVGRVLHEVLAAAGVDVRVLRLRDEAADDEGVVPALAVEEELALVAEDVEDVLAGPAAEDSCEADTGGELAARGVEEALGPELAVERQVRAVGGEELAHAEHVVARAAVDRDRRGGVVEGERVVAGQTLDEHAAVDAVGVGDLLGLGVEAGGVAGRELRHETLAAVGVATEQEDVVAVGAQDHEAVGAAVVAAVVDVEAAVAVAPHADQVGVRAALAVDVEQADDRVDLAVADECVDDQPVVAGLAADGRRAAGVLDEDAVRARTALDRRLAVERALDQQGVVAGAELEREDLEGVVVDDAVAHADHRDRDRPRARGLQAQVLHRDVVRRVPAGSVGEVAGEADGPAAARLAHLDGPCSEHRLDGGGHLHGGHVEVELRGGLRRGSRAEGEGEASADGAVHTHHLHTIRVGAVQRHGAVAAHAEAGEAGGIEQADEVGVLLRADQLDGVAAGAAGQLQVRRDVAEDRVTRRGVADAHPVVTAAEVDVRGTVDALDEHGVAAAARADRRRAGVAGVAALDQQGVAAGAEVDVEALDVEVGGAAAGHAETGEGGRRQDAVVGRGVSLVAEPERVVAGPALDRQRRGDAVERAVRVGDDRDRPAVDGGRSEARHVADDERVVAETGLDRVRGAGGDPLDEHAVVAGVRTHLDALEAAVRDDHGAVALRGGPLGARDGVLPADDVDDDVLTQGGAVHVEGVAVGPADDVDARADGVAGAVGRVPEGRDHDQVAAGHAADRRRSGEPEHAPAAAGHGQRAVGVADEEHVARGAAGEVHDLEDAAQRLHDAAGGEAAARRAAGDLADHQQVVADEEVPVERLDERVRAALVAEDILAFAAGDGVVAQAAVDDVVEPAADDRVVAAAAAEHEGEGAVGQRRGVDAVTAADGLDRERVALAAQAVGDPDPVAEARRDQRAGRVVAHRSVREREGVGSGAALDREGVPGQVVGVPDIRHLAGEALTVVVGDRLGRGAHDGDGAAEVDGHVGDAASSQVLDHDGVGARARVEIEPLDRGDRLRGARSALGSVGQRQGAGAAAGERDRVAGGSERDEQEVGARPAVDRESRDRRAGEGHLDRIVAGAAVEGPAGAGELVVASVALEDVGGGAAEDEVVPGASLEGGRPGADVADDVLTAVALQRRAADGRQHVVAVAALEEGAGVSRLIAEHVRAGAAADGHGHEHAGLHDEGVVAIAEVAVDPGDVLVGVAAAVRRDLDRRVAGGAADLLDDDRLVLVTGLAVPDVAVLRQVADVEVEDAAGRGVLVVPGAVGAAAVAGHEDRRRELQVADGESQRAADREEEELHPDADAQLDLHPPVHACGARVEAEREADPDARQGDAEELHPDAGIALEEEPVLVPLRVRVVDRLDEDVEVAHDPGRVAAELHPAVQLHTEVAGVVDVDRGGQGREAEEVDGRVGVQVPGPARGVGGVAELDAEAGVEVQDLEDRDLAGDGEQEAALHPEPGLTGGVDLDGAGGGDAEDGGVGGGVDRECEHDAVAVDADGAVGAEGQRTHGEGQTDLQLEGGSVGTNVQVAGRGDAQQRDLAVDVEHEAGEDGRRADRLGGAGGVDPDVCAGIDLDARDVQGEGDLDVCHQAGAADLEAAAHVHQTDVGQLHGAVHGQDDVRVAGAGADGEVGVGVDDQRVADVEVAGQEDLEAVRDLDGLVDHLEAARGVAVEAVEDGEDRAAGAGAVADVLDGLRADLLLLHLEGLDRLLRAEGVDLEQHLAVEGDARDRCAAERELHAADDAGLDSDVHREVHDTGQRAEHRDVHADGAVELEVRRAGGIDGGRDGDEAVHLDDTGDEQPRLDDRLDVDLSTGRGVGVALAVEAGGGPEDRDVAGHLPRQDQDLADGVGQDEGDVATHRVEEDGHAAGRLEERHVGDADAAARGDLDAARDALGVDDEERGGVAVGQLGLADAEGQLGGGEDGELEAALGLDADVEAADELEQVGVGAGRPDPHDAGELEAEAARSQLVGAGDVRAALADALEGDGLGLGDARRVDLQEALGPQVDAVLLQLGEVRLQARHTPEAGGAAGAVAHVEHEPAGRRAHRAELDELQLTVEREGEELARAVDLQGDVGDELDERLGQARQRQDEAAGDVDEERLGGLDQLERRDAADARIAVGVAPGVVEHLDGDRADRQLAGEEVAEGGVADLEDRVGGVLREARDRGELVADHGAQVDLAGARREAHVDPGARHDLLRGGGDHRAGALVHAEGIGPAVRREREREVAGGGADDEVAVGVGLPQPHGLADDQHGVAVAAVDGELGACVEHRGGVGAGEGDVDPAAAVQVDGGEPLAVGRVGEAAARRGDEEGLGLGEVRGAVGVAEAAGDEAEGVGAVLQGAGEREAPYVGGADPDRGAEGDGAARTGEDELAAVDAGGVDGVAGGGAEADLDVAEGVDPVAPDAGAGETADLVAVGADRVGSGSGDGEALRRGPAGRWGPRRDGVEVRQVEGQHDLTGLELAVERQTQVAVGEHGEGVHRRGAGAAARHGDPLARQVREQVEEILVDERHVEVDVAPLVQEIDVDLAADAGVDDLDGLAGHREADRGLRVAGAGHVAVVGVLEGARGEADAYDAQADVRRAEQVADPGRSGHAHRRGEHLRVRRVGDVQRVGGEHHDLHRFGGVVVEDLLDAVHRAHLEPVVRDSRGSGDADDGDGGQGAAPGGAGGRRGAARGQGGLLRAVDQLQPVDRRAGRRLVDDVEVVLAAVRVEQRGQRVDVDAAAAARRLHDLRGRRLSGSPAGARVLVRNGEDDLLAGGVAEAHLQLAVQREHAHLVGDVGQEEDRDVAVGDLGQVGVQATGDRELVGGEVELALDQELAVGRDLDRHLAVEDLLGGVDRVDLGRAGDRHRRGEGCSEAVQRRVGVQGRGLQRHLLLEAREPLVRRHRGGQVEGRAPQCERVVDAGQRLEELDARGEVVDRQARVGLEHDAAGHLDVDEDLERAQLGEADADREAGHAGHGEAALEAQVEDALGHLGRAVEDADDVEVLVEAQDAADQPGVDLAAEHRALDGHAEGVDADDRELALGEQRRLDAYALDGAGELETAETLDARDARRQHEHEVLGRVLDVVPLDADGVDADREEGGPLERAARGGADGDEDAEAGQRTEVAVAEEPEVAALAGELETPDGDRRADGLELHQELVVRCAGVEHEVAGAQGHERAERDRERVDLELEGVHASCAEGQLRPQRLGVGRAVGVRVVRGRAVADRRGEALAREEGGAAGRDVDGAAERLGLVEVDRKPLHTDPDVLEAEDAEEVDVLVDRRRGARLAQRVAGLSGRTGRHRGQPVGELGSAQLEAVVVDDQARDHTGGEILVLRRADVLAGGRVVRPQAARHSQRREGDGGGVDPQQLAWAVHRAVVLGVVAEHDPFGRQLRDIGDLGLERGHADAPGARGLDAHVAAQEPEDIDSEVEGALQAEQLDADAGSRLGIRGAGRRGGAAGRRGAARGSLAPEVQRGAADPEVDGQHQHAVLEADVADAHGGVVERERPEADRSARDLGAGGRGVEGEGLGDARHVPAGGRDARRRGADRRGSRGRPRRLPLQLARRRGAPAEELHRDGAGAEEVDAVGLVAVLEVVAVGHRRGVGLEAVDQHRQAHDHRGSRGVAHQVEHAGAGDRELGGDVLDGRLVDRSAVEAREGHVQVAARVELRSREALAVERAHERGDGAEAVRGVLHQEEALGLGHGPDAAVVGEAACQEPHLHDAGPGRAPAREGVGPGVHAAGHGRRRAQRDGLPAAVEPDLELCAAVGDARRVDADPVQVVEHHDEAPGAVAGRVGLPEVEVVQRDLAPVQRSGQVDRREEHRRGRVGRRVARRAARGLGGHGREERVAGDLEARQSEPGDRGDHEGGVSAQGDDPVAIDADDHRGVADREVERAVGLAVDDQRARDLEDAGHAELEVRHDERVGLRRDHGAVERDRVDGAGVDLEDDRAADVEPVEAEQGDVAGDLQRVRVAGALEEVDRRVLHEQADRVLDRRAVGRGARAADVHQQVGAGEAARADREVALDLQQPAEVEVDRAGEGDVGLGGAGRGDVEGDRAAGDGERLGVRLGHRVDLDADAGALLPARDVDAHAAGQLRRRAGGRGGGALHHDDDAGDVFERRVSGCADHGAADDPDDEEALVVRRRVAHRVDAVAAVVDALLEEEHSGDAHALEHDRRVGADGEVRSGRQVDGQGGPVDGDRAVDGLTCGVDRQLEGRGDVEAELRREGVGQVDRACGGAGDARRGEHEGALPAGHAYAEVIGLAWALRVAEEELQLGEGDGDDLLARPGGEGRGLLIEDEDAGDGLPHDREARGGGRAAGLHPQVGGGRGARRHIDVVVDPGKLDRGVDGGGAGVHLDRDGEGLPVDAEHELVAELRLHRCAELDRAGEVGGHALRGQDHRAGDAEDQQVLGAVAESELDVERDPHLLGEGVLLHGERAGQLLAGDAELDVGAGHLDPGRDAAGRGCRRVDLQREVALQRHVRDVERHAHGHLADHAARRRDDELALAVADDDDRAACRAQLEPHVGEADARREDRGRAAGVGLALHRQVGGEALTGDGQRDAGRSDPEVRARLDLERPGDPADDELLVDGHAALVDEHLDAADRRRRRAAAEVEPGAAGDLTGEALRAEQQQGAAVGDPQAGVVLLVRLDRGLGVVRGAALDAGEQSHVVDRDLQRRAVVGRAQHAVGARGRGLLEGEGTVEADEGIAHGADLEADRGGRRAELEADEGSGRKRDGARAAAHRRLRRVRVEEQPHGERAEADVAGQAHDGDVGRDAGRDSGAADDEVA